MHPSVTILASLLLVSCGKGDDDDADGDGGSDRVQSEGDVFGDCRDGVDNDDDGAVDCDDDGCRRVPACRDDRPDYPTYGTTTDPGYRGCEVEEAYPEDGARDVFYRTRVEVIVSGSMGDEQIHLFEADGARVEGALSRDGDRIVFSPSAPLTPDTDYEVVLEACGRAVESAWTTSAVGTPLEDLTAIDSGYLLDLRSGRFAHPPGVGPLLQQQLEEMVVLGVSNATATTLDLLVGPAAGTEQDVCQPTSAPAGSVRFENPWFEANGVVINLMIEGFEVPLHEATLSGAFTADGSRIEGVAITAVIDTRTMLALVGGTEDGDVCDLVAAFGTRCEPCADGSGPFCLPARIDTMQASDGGLDVVPITEADVDGNEACVGS